MNAAALQIVKAAIRAARVLDPDGAVEFADYLAAHSGRRREEKSDAILLTQAETGRMLGISRWSVRLLTMDGRLHPVTLRGAKRYRRAEVLQLAGEAPQ